MPREARKNYNTSFFHIMVQGIRREYIFNENDDKEYYIKLLYRYFLKFKIKIIAYCIMSNHAHILVYFEDIKELSEYMRSVNTAYAIYYKRKYKVVGYIFRNRYQTEPIYNEKYLINCINYIHDNPIKANICKTVEHYKYSSYCEYKYGLEGLIKESLERFPDINCLYIDNIFEHKEIDYSYMDYEEDKVFMNKKDVIMNYLISKRINKNKIKENENYLREISIDLNKKCGTTHREIANEFGVSRTKITRLINKR